MSVCLPQRCLCCHLLKCSSLGVIRGLGKHDTRLNYSKALDWILGVCAILSSLLWKNTFPAVSGVLTPRYVIPTCLTGSREWREICITVLFVVIEHVCDKYRWGDSVGVPGWRNASMFWACPTVPCFRVGLRFGRVKVHLTWWEVWGLLFSPIHVSLPSFGIFKWTHSRESNLASLSQTPQTKSFPAQSCDTAAVLPIRPTCTWLLHDFPLGAVIRQRLKNKILGNVATGIAAGEKKF